MNQELKPEPEEEHSKVNDWDPSKSNSKNEDDE